MSTSIGSSREDMFVSPHSHHAEFHPPRKGVPNPEVERRIVLLGRAGAGKSATANTIFGRHLFLEARWGRFHTKECQRAVVSKYGRRLEILDTPGFLLDEDISDPKVKREFAKVIGISSPGPHIFAFVFPTPHMHRCDVEIFQKFIHVFGEEVLNYTLLVFSKVDDLDYFSLTKQAFILSAPSEWKAIMKACRYRCVWFQNRSHSNDKEVMVRTFVETMDNIVTQNLGQYFCNDLFWTVEKTIIERDIRQCDANAKLSKLRKKLRVNLDAGISVTYGDTRKDPNRTREDLRADLINNKRRLIDSIWATIKYFNCVKVLRRPKRLTDRQQQQQQHVQYDGLDLDFPHSQHEDRVLDSRLDQQRQHTTTAQPKEVKKRGQLPKIDRIQKGMVDRKQESEFPKAHVTRLPRLIQKKQ